MITMTIILISALAIAITTAVFLIVGGAGFILAFGDLIVCGMILWFIVRLFRRR